MFEVLHESGALARVLPEIATALPRSPTRPRSRCACSILPRAQDATLEVRFAVLARVFDPLALESLAQRLKLPAACRDLALLAARHANLIADAQELDAAELLELLDSTDAWRRPERFADLVDAALVGERHAAAVRAAARDGARAAAARQRRRDREAGEDAGRDPPAHRRGAAGGDPRRPGNA